MTSKWNLNEERRTGCGSAPVFGAMCVVVAPGLSYHRRGRLARPHQNEAGRTLRHHLNTPAQNHVLRPQPETMLEQKTLEASRFSATALYYC
jgi:hypothetical protein